MTVVFIGTAPFAVPSLRRLVEAGHRIPLVVTPPDRPGHRLRLTASAVKAAAIEMGLEVFQPERIRAPEAVARIGRTGPDLLAVAAYGQIIPAPLLELPRLGPLNVHASVLPRWRGAAPVAHAILAGDRTTGVTVIRMDGQVDHGPVLAVAEEAIRPDDDSPGLTARLAELGGTLLARTIPRLADIEPRAQDESLATYADKLSRDDGDLEWSLTAVALDRRVRAFRPWPGVTLPFGGARVKVLVGTLLTGSGSPGEILAAGRDGVEVACAEGSYRLEEVQPPGRRPVAARVLLADHA